MAQRRDSLADLPAWTAPALVVAGERDQLMPRSELETLARRIPRARLQVIGGAGHLPFLERPREVAPLLTAHLQLKVRE